MHTMRTRTWEYTTSLHITENASHTYIAYLHCIHAYKNLHDYMETYISTHIRYIISHCVKLRLGTPHYNTYINVLPYNYTYVQTTTHTIKRSIFHHMSIRLSSLRHTLLHSYLHCIFTRFHTYIHTYS